MAEKERQTRREKAEKDTQAFAALGVAFVCIVIGVPLWWKTTEVYRVNLPHVEIAQLADISVNQVQYEVEFTLLLFGDSWDKGQLANFGRQLKEELETIGGRDLKVSYRGNIRHAQSEEEGALNNAKSIEELDFLLDAQRSARERGKYYIILLPQSTPLDPKSGIVGTRRSTFIKTDGIEGVFPIIKHVVQELYVDEAAMARMYRTAFDSKSLKTDKESMRALRYHSGYDVTFTLLNPQPDILNVTWNIQDAIKKYLRPLLNAFKDYTHLTLKSQYLHFTSLSVRPRKSKDGSYHMLTQENLPHLINPIESLLNSHISINPHLNFILYVPSRDQSPLHIQEDSGSRAQVDAFLSPRWGGMMILNIPDPAENVSLPAPVQPDMRQVMEVFLSQLRLLIGINKQTSILGIEIRQPGNAAVCLWEVDQWLRGHTLENIATATATLKSLVQLLDEVGNIVIKDDIGQEVEKSVANIQKSRTFLAQGQLQEAFATARQAVISSEKAFFDPSLLELLYFPEDQKFAIYIPLFLPISIPVLLSLIQAIRWFRAGRKVEETSTESKKNK